MVRSKNMKRHGYVKCAAASIAVQLSDVAYNTEEIKKIIDAAVVRQVELLVFQELCLTGYTCQDLFGQASLLHECEQALMNLAEYTQNTSMLVIVGAPLVFNNQLYNCAVLLNQGKILGVIPKSYLPNYSEFYEQRWFASGAAIKGQQIKLGQEHIPFGCDMLFQHTELNDFIVGVEICEDLWSPVPPSSFLSVGGATVIANLSASNETVGKYAYRKSLVQMTSASRDCGYLYASAGWGESTTDVVFDGHCMIYENGTLLKESARFEMESSFIVSDIDIQKLVKERRCNNVFGDSQIWIADLKKQFQVVPFYSESNSDKLEYPVNKHPFIPRDIQQRNKVCEEIFNIQTNGLAQRFRHIRCQRMVIGISGGLDSTLALLVCIRVCDKLHLPHSTITAVTMPGFGTTDRTYENAVELIKHAGASFREVSIKNVCLQHFKDIGQDTQIHDVTYENAQARERTQILMDIANQENGMVIGTGDLSELALGWATYNGDHMSMYGVNSGIPKTLIKYLVQWYGDSAEKEIKALLHDVVDTPISPELLPPNLAGEIHQKTEDSVGKYELQDFYLYYVVRYGFTPEKIYYLATLAFQDVYEKSYLKECLILFYKRFFNNQFKRSCLPDGPKVGSVTLSPRGDWRMPSDASAALWLKTAEQIDVH